MEQPQAQQAAGQQLTLEQLYQQQAEQISLLQQGMQHLLLQQAQPAPAPAPAVTSFKPLKPPKYGGAKPHEELQAWFLTMETFLVACSVTLASVQAVDLAATYLDKQLVVWWANQKKAHPQGQPYATWEAFKDALQKWLLPEDSGKAAFSKLQRLHQTGPVTYYINAFNTLMLQLTSMDPQTRLLMFMQGLKAEVRKYVEMQQPADLQKAQELASVADRACFEEKRSHSSSRHTTPIPQAAAAAGAAQGPTPMELGATAADVEVPKCYICNSTEHFWRSCPDRGRGRGRGRGRFYYGRGRGQGRGRHNPNHGAPN